MALTPANVPPWLLGKSVTSVSIQAYYVSNTATGAVSTSGASMTLTGIIDQINYRGQTTTENIYPLTSQRDNEVPIEADDTLELVEILRTGTGNSFLAAAWNAANGADYAYATFTRGTMKIEYFGLMESYSEGISKGKNTARLMLRIADLGNGQVSPLSTVPPL